MLTRARLLKAGACAALPVTDVDGANVNDRILYVSQQGNGADGLSWPTAFTSISAAMQTITFQGCSVYVAAGVYQENVTLPQDQVCLIAAGGGAGNPGSNRGVIIRSLSDTLDCVTVGHNYCQVRGIGTQGHSPTNVAGGIRLDGANYCRVDDWVHYGTTAGANPTAQYGGSGLFATHGEGNELHHIAMVHCNVGLNLCEEWDTNLLTGITGSANWQDMWVNGVYTKGSGANSSAGGNTFIRFKAVAGVGSSSVPCVWWQNNQNGGGHPGNDVLISCDFDEGSNQSVLIDSGVYNLTFIGQQSPSGWTDNSASSPYPPAGNTYIPTLGEGGATSFGPASQWAPDLFVTAPPVSPNKTFYTGQRAWNSQPASGKPQGWVCVAGGKPGTWQPMSNLP